MNKRLLNKLIVFFALVGLGVSGYLLYVYTYGLPLPCSSNGCEIVRYSKYSSMFGVPVPLYGVVFYLTVLAIGVGLLVWSRRMLKWLLLWVTVGGFGFSVYFTFLELFVIHAICIWCVVSAGVSTGLLGLSVW